MLTGLFDLLGLSGDHTDDTSGRARIVAASRPALLYAIGDIHGCLAELISLEQMITADAAGTDGEKWIVTLGDYIDRGPASAQVIDHLMATPPPGFRRVCIAGNHEQMLLDFLRAPRRGEAWLDSGGLDTARSYGLSDLALQLAPAPLAKALEGRIPTTHRQWLFGLPVALSVPGFIFVHAGLRPGLPLDRQADDDLMWTREPFIDSVTAGESVVVHGHTPSSAPVVALARIGIDTGAFASGRLTALKLEANGRTSFLSTR